MIFGLCTCHGAAKLASDSVAVSEVLAEFRSLNKNAFEASSLNAA